MNGQPDRRVLSIWPTHQRAKVAALGVRLGDAEDVQVELGIRGTTPARPWAVTAAKPKKRAAS